MRRDPPDSIKRALREEVGFGCPVHDCRLPFLTFHHFDPPWETRQHHDLNGMIALCEMHHRRADRRVFSSEQLHAFKKSPTTTELIRGKFDWAGPNQIIRMGGVYTQPWRGIIRGFTGLSDEMLRFDTSTEGLLDLSFTLRDGKNRTLVMMENNTFSGYPKNIKDLNIDASATKIKFRNGNYVLELGSSRMTLEQLSEMLSEDGRRHKDFFARKARGNDQFRGYNIISRVGTDGMVTDSYLGNHPLLEERTPGPAEADYYCDHVARTVRDRAERFFLDSFGTVPILDIRKFVTESDEGLFEIDKGKGIYVGGRGHAFGCVFGRKDDAPAMEQS